jgi:hypothetical protein
MYVKTGTLPPLGAGRNAALMKSNIINMAALMQSGKSPDEAASTIVTINKIYKLKILHYATLVLV